MGSVLRLTTPADGSDLRLGTRVGTRPRPPMNSTTDPDPN